MKCKHCGMERKSPPWDQCIHCGMTEYELGTRDDKYTRQVVERLCEHPEEIEFALSLLTVEAGQRLLVELGYKDVTF